MKGILFLIIFTFTIPAFPKPLNCVRVFNQKFRKKTFNEKVKLVRDLKKKELKCLYYSAKKLQWPTMSFFEHVFKINGKRVQRFIGKNSLGIYNNFEKHFFTVDSPNGQMLFGYNKSPAHWFAGPGFFKVEIEPSGKMVFDYRFNFENLISKNQFEQWGGRSVEKVKNNYRSVVYGGGLLDDCYQLNDEVLVLKAYKLSNRSGKKTTFAYDVILKVPSCLDRQDCGSRHTQQN